ncbi:MAG: glycoside hydrolase family 3 N-terminal domain-containing protein [Faecousia sp.]
MAKSSKLRRACASFLALVVGITGVLGMTASAAAADGYDQTTLYEEGYKIDIELEEDGAVLFQNKNNVLPLSEDVQADLYGYFSYNIIHGGGGSGKGKWDADCLQEKAAFELAGLDVNDDLWAWMGSKNGAGLVQESWVADSGGTYVNGNTYDLPEVPVETYRKSLSVAKPGENVAIVTIGRQGHEGAELPMSMENNNISTDKRKGSADRTYLDPTETELEMLKYLKEEAGYETVILLINSSNVMTIGEYMEYTDAILWIGGPGESGLVGVANLLLGRDSTGKQISPSGATADTWMYDFYSYPVFYNNGNGTTYTNLTEGGMGSPKYNQYEEGIFMGYRWYETAYADKLVLQGSNTDEDGNYITYDFYNDYDSIVAMPFGGGLSYTTFEWEIVESDVKLEIHGTNTVRVKVTNTGDWAGKDTVQIYVHAPYYEGSIDKAEVVLAGFAKTDRLKPGESGIVTITFDTDDIASYDYLGYIASERGTDNNGNPKFGGYVLEHGEYEIRVQTDAHTQMTDPIKVTVEKDIIYTEDADGIRDSDETEAYNKLNDVNAGDGSGTMVYMQRSTLAEDWDSITNLNVMGDGIRCRQDELGEATTSFDPMSGQEVTTVTSNVALGDAQSTLVNTQKQGESTVTLQVPYQNSFKTITLHYGYQGASEFVGNTGTNYWGLSNNDDFYKNVVAGIGNSTTNYTVDTRFVRSADGTISASDAVTEDTDPATSYGWDEIPWDDSRWDDFADQISLEDLVNFQGRSWSGSFAGSSSISASDGPGEAGTGGKEGNTWFCSEVVMASTWNPELIERVGQIYGKQCVRTGITSCYGPAMDTHRSPFGGRNFEYYSEDGLLAGIMCIAETAGIQSEGVGTFNKHFMLNDLDGGRSGQIDWCNEQALREIYIRAWEYSIKHEDAPMSGMMASLNRIGLSWGHRGVYVGILRDEFGFKGLLISDGMDVESATGSVKAAFSQIACLLWSKTVTAETSVAQDGYIFKNNVVSADSINDYYAVYQLRETWKNRLWYDTHILCNGDIFTMDYWEPLNTVNYEKMPVKNLTDPAPVQITIPGESDNTGMIIGIVVAVIVAAGAVCAGVVISRKKKANQ